MDTNGSEKAAISSDWKAFLLLMGMVLWFNHEMAWTGKVPFFRDLGPYFYPIRWSLAESFRSGELPLWNRHMGAGFPLLADFQSGTFYPPHLFYLFLPFFAAVKACFFFHYGLAAGGSFVLCRHWGYALPLSLIGGILFAFGGGIVSLSNLLNHFQAAVWLPWVLWSGERCFRHPSFRSFLFLTTTLLLQFLAGSPEVYIMTIGLLFLDGVRIMGKSGQTAILRFLGLFLATNSLVLALAMAQVLPTAELLLESRGRGILSYQDSTFWSLRPLSLLNMVFLDKEVNWSVSNGVQSYLSTELPLNVSLYLGAAALPALVLWLSRGPIREKALLLGLIFISVALTLGAHTPLYAFLFQYVPFFSFFRFPEKFFFVTYALFIFAILKGLDACLRADDNRPPAILLSLCSLGLLLLLFYLFLRLDTEPLSRFVARSARLPLLSGPVLAMASAILVNVERQMALIACISAILVLLWLKRSKSTLLTGLLVAVIFIDLESAHRPYQYLLKPDFVFKASRILSAPEPYRLFHYAGASDLHPSYYRISRRLSFDELQAAVFGNLLPNTGVFHGFDYLQEVDALARWPYVVFLNFMNRQAPEKQYRVLGALNVRYINSFHPLTETGIRLVRHFPEHPSWLYRIERAAPRAFVVSKVHLEPDPFRTLQKLSSDGFDPTTEVVLDRPLGVVAPRRDFRARSEIVHYTDRGVSIRASLNASGILVLSDSFYPGWRVRVNGQEVEAVRANLFFRAVFLSAGDHRVEFRYEPRSFYAGVLISLGALIGLASGTVFLVIFKKTPEPGAMNHDAS